MGIRMGSRRRRRDEHPCRIGISGSYGGINLGDESILQGIVASLRARGPFEITVFSRDAEDTARRHDVEHAVDRPGLSRDEARALIEPLDLFILGGGGLLYDQDVDIYLREVALAHDLGVPVMTYAISAGPLERTANRTLVRETLDRCAAITVRDRFAQHILEEVGVEQEIRLTADPALLIETEPLDDDVLRGEGIDPDRRLVGFSVREPGPAAPRIDPDHYHSLLADAGDYVVDRLEADVIFVPIERKNQDLQHSHAVVSKMQRADRAFVLKQEYAPGQLIDLMRRFEFAVGMRLHFLIFATLADVPFVALPYASKIGGFLDDLELEMPKLEGGGAGQLIAHIDRSWDHRDAIRRTISRRLPELRARARETARIAANLCTELRDAEPPAS